MNGLGPLDLLIIQGSPFCNINCTYCYLPHRNITTKIPLEIIEKISSRLVEANLIDKEFTIVWHAGEPLAIPINYYQNIFDVFETTLPSNVEISHSFQTNGTLLNDEWCEFINKHKIKIGLSIDGPDFIHDKYRVKRNGKGSHSDVMRGVDVLRKHNIDFHVISVISEFSLDYPQEIFDFFLSNDIQRVGFNIEEVEGINSVSSINKGSEEKIGLFMKQILELQKANKGKIVLREFESAFRKIIGTPVLAKNSIFDTIPQSHLLNTYGIISIDCDGNFTTFSPELLGQKSIAYDDFKLGNILTDSFVDAVKSEKFKKINDDILGGIEQCKKECEYFKVCGGGAPSNKYYENGTFRSTETLFCKYAIQLPIDLILGDLENSYSLVH